jgi:ABC-type transporter Mla subunit MlaD
MSDGRTGSLVSALAEGVRQDLADIATAIENTRAMIDTLGESARAINGLKDDAAGWSNHLAGILAEVSKAGSEIPAKLLGNPINPIHTSVDTEHAEKVRAARKTA